MAPQQVLEFVDFPESGVLSLLQALKSGEPTEIATRGREGMIGTSLIFGVALNNHQTICQVEGTAHRLARSDFLRHLSASPLLKALCERYVVTLFDQVARTLACNRNHSNEQRCARWLLMTADRCQSKTFPMTQDFLAAMLGCSRTLVNTSAGELQKARLITYVRGKITILDQAGLEKVCCECHQEMSKFSAQIMEFERPPEVA